MTLEQHMSAAPQWIQWWMMWMAIVNVAALLFVVKWRNGRFHIGHAEAFAILAALIGIIIVVPLIFDQVGYVRLLGLGHIPFWGPLAIYLWTRLPKHPLRNTFGIYLRIFLVTTLISLAFDVTDTVRYLAGEHSVM